MTSITARPRFYGLLFVATQKESHANLRPQSRNPVDIYLLCSALCAASVEASGGSFALITNNICHLRARCGVLDITNLELIEYPFRWPVPEGIGFYSAHFKLELIEAFGTGQFGESAALIDIDTVLWKPLDLPPLTDNGLIAYDITSTEIASYELPHICNDLAKVSGCVPRDPRWYGGEFLMGTAAGFATLAKKIRKFWPSYLKAVGSLRHVGDETLVSAAINLAVEAGLPLLNADCEGGVARWWTARTHIPSRTFKQIENRSLLHLPADKEFLATFPRNSFDGSSFVAAYRKYAARKLLGRRVINMFSRRQEGGRRFVARMG